jgi:hypothetical protein
METYVIPNLISEAKLDGTKYVVFDPSQNKGTELDDGWLVASYKNGVWISFVPVGIKLHPTHFVPYYRERK